MNGIIGWLLPTVAGVVVLGWVVFLVGSSNGYEGPFMGTATYIAGFSLVAAILGVVFGVGGLFSGRR